jgi:hypothetical protein
MQLAGSAITDRDTFELARVLHESGFPEVAEKLERALTLGTQIFGLSITDRESMLSALGHPPTDGLADFRAVLLRDQAWRMREGLV